MENIKEFIKMIENEVELLEKDLLIVKNRVSEKALQISIQNRKERIMELTEKYL